MTWRIFLTASGGLVIEYGDGAAQCLYSSSVGAPVMYNGNPNDFGKPRVAINHKQLIKALRAMEPGDYSEEL